MSESVRVRATVKWFDDVKGFGFIICPSHNKDIFVHKSQVTKSGLPTLKEGEKVTIVVCEGLKGLYASNIAKE